METTTTTGKGIWDDHSQDPKYVIGYLETFEGVFELSVNCDLHIFLCGIYRKYFLYSNKSVGPLTAPYGSHVCGLFAFLQ